jgi:hypothetical protein
LRNLAKNIAAAFGCRLSDYLRRRKNKPFERLKGFFKLSRESWKNLLRGKIGYCQRFCAKEPFTRMAAGRIAAFGFLSGLV